MNTAIRKQVDPCFPDVLMPDSAGIGFFTNERFAFMFLFMQIDLFQSFQNHFIRRAEFIPVDFVHCDPADVVVLQLLGYALPNRSMKESQVYRQIRVFMGHVHKLVSHLQRNGQFLPTLADESLLFCLARFHLSAHKLPQQSSGFVGRALAGHEFVVIPNQGSHHFCHSLHLPFSISFIIEGPAVFGKTQPTIFTCIPLPSPHHTGLDGQKNV